jgi:hypothetical protein
MPNLSRRHLVTAAAALPAFALPALVDPAGADAELVAAGDALALLMPTYVEVWDDYSDRGWEAHRLARERSGIDKHLDEDRTDIFMKELGTSFDETGANEVNKNCQAISEQTEPLSRRIMELPVHTLAGLRAKAIVAIHTSDGLWDCPLNDLDWDKIGYRVLIEAVCQITGHPVPIEASDDVEA